MLKPGFRSVAKTAAPTRLPLRALLSCWNLVLTLHAPRPPDFSEFRSAVPQQLFRTSTTLKKADSGGCVCREDYILLILPYSILSSQQAGALITPTQQCIRAATCRRSPLESHLQATAFVPGLFCAFEQTEAQGSFDLPEG